MTGYVHRTTVGATLLTMGIVMPTMASPFGGTLYPLLAIPTGILATGLVDWDLESMKTSKGKPFMQKLKMGMSVKHQLGRRFSHRGLTHTLVFPTAFAYGWLVLVGALSLTSPMESLAITLVNSIIFGWIFGWLHHIVGCDIFNGKGVPLFWPIFPAKIHILKIRSGEESAGENIFLVIYILACIAVVANHFGVFKMIGH